MLVAHTGQRVGKHDVWSGGETAGFACFCSPHGLSFCRHAGPIPAELGSLSALTELHLNSNQLSGERRQAVLPAFASSAWVPCIYAFFRSAGHTVCKPEHTPQVIFFLAVFLDKYNPRHLGNGDISHMMSSMFFANAGCGYHTQVHFLSLIHI